MPPAPIRTFPTPDALGDALAAQLLAEIAETRAHGRRRYLLGCPTGRTPRPIFGAMARRLAATPQDLSHVVLVLMDEYLVPDSEGELRWASASAPWSCHHFAGAEIAGRLNASVGAQERVQDASVWFPDPARPGEYDRRIEDAGGVDHFLLASGASDGHVAFNPPGSPRDSRTRIIPLSDDTRRDNLQTFPSFGTLETVPHHGVSVGIATITASGRATMVATGAGKRETVRRMRAATAYDASWPATLIHECAGGEIWVDEAADG